MKKKNECFKVKEDEFLALRVNSLLDSSPAFQIYPASFATYSMLKKLIKKEYKILRPFEVEDVFLVCDCEMSWQEIKKGSISSWSVVDSRSFIVLYEIKLYLVKGKYDDEKNCID